MVKISFESDSIDELLIQVADLASAISGLNRETVQKVSPIVDGKSPIGDGKAPNVVATTAEKRGRGRPRKDSGVVSSSTSEKVSSTVVKVAERDSSTVQTGITADGLSEQESSDSHPDLTSGESPAALSPLSPPPSNYSYTAGLPSMGIPPASVLAAQAAESSSLDEVKDIFKRLSKKKGIESCIAIAKEFEIKSVSLLHKSKHAAFITRCTELLEK